MDPVLLVLILAAPGPSMLSAPIAHCRDADGIILFTDPPCPPGSTSEPWQGGSTTWIDFGPVPESTYRPRRNRRSSQSPRPSTTDDECAAVRADLDALRDRRRSGYRLSEEASLDQKEVRLKIQKRKLC